MPPVKLFLSTVSAEFRSYRDELRSKLQRPNVTVHVQEDFIPTGTETLDKLDLYIKDCDAVVNLVGDRTGAWAKEPTLQTLKARYSDLVEVLPALKPSLEPGEPPLSYTQWEAYLSVYHRKVLLVAVAAPEAPRDENLPIVPELQAGQRAHLERLRQLGRYPEITFTNKEQLVAEVLRSTVFDLLVKAQSEPKVSISLDEQGLRRVLQEELGRVAEEKGMPIPPLRAVSPPSRGCDQLAHSLSMSLPPRTQGRFQRPAQSDAEYRSS
jgi:hypothetical protein